MNRFAASCADMAIPRHILVSTARPNSVLGERSIRARAAAKTDKCKVAYTETDLAELLIVFHKQASGMPVDLTLDNAADFQLVRRVWETLSENDKPDVCVRLETLSASSLPGHWLIDLGNASGLELQNRIAALSKHGDMAVLTRNAPLFWSDHIATLTLSINPTAAILRDTTLVSITNDSSIVFTSQPVLSQIPRAFWKNIFVIALPNVQSFDATGVLCQLRFCAQEAPTTLFVFPERMLPLQRAYYMRAMDLLLGLAYANQYTAVLVLGPSNDDIDRIRHILEIFSPAVTVSPLVRGSFSPVHKIVRKIERYLRRQSGILSNAPLRYSERRMIFATPQNTSLLAEVLSEQPTIKNVVYTGAWFSRCMVEVKRMHQGVRWFCDTHDVFFVVDAGNDPDDRHFLYSAVGQQKLEISDLELANAVITISSSDRDALAGAGLARPLLVESGSFSHAYTSTLTCSTVESISFGFVGSGNKNNQKCLALIREVWWPFILDHWPDAHLRLAGGICRTNEAEMLLDKFANSVTSLGFIPSLESFYSSTSIMLSPIKIQGGLNFKSVEALMAGCFLLTNTLGSRCLGEAAEGMFIVDTNGANIPSILDEIAATLDLEAQRTAIRTVANQRYSDDAAYANLVAILTNSDTYYSEGNAK